MERNGAVYLGVYVSIATHAELKQIAKEREVSMSALIRQVLREFIANEKKTA